MNDLFAQLEAHRLAERNLLWQGTFRDYVALACATPQVARLSHARVYDMLMAQGAQSTPDGQSTYGFFEQELFGIDRPLQQIVEYFSSAAQRLEVRNRILLLMGPVGGGKSTIRSLYN